MTLRRNVMSERFQDLISWGAEKMKLEKVPFLRFQGKHALADDLLKNPKRDFAKEGTNAFLKLETILEVASMSSGLARRLRENLYLPKELWEIYKSETQFPTGPRKEIGSPFLGEEVSIKIYRASLALKNVRGEGGDANLDKYIFIAAIGAAEELRVWAGGA